MIAFLETEAEGRPICVTSAEPTHEGKAPTGLVTSTIAHGDLFLFPKGERETVYRLRWSPEDTERERSLPVGLYRVMGYRHVAKADDGKEWIWSTASPFFRELEVTADGTAHCAVKRGLAVKARWFEKKGKQRAALVFLAEKRLGNTLYRDGKRIGIRWQSLDEEGAVLAEGAMRYG